MPVTLMRSKPRTQEDVLQRYPRLTAHLICSSLGYFTPRSAANAILQYTKNEPCYCEWYYDWSIKGKLDLREVGRKSLEIAFMHRHYHKGPMAEYQQAIALVENARSGGKDPLFASWF